MESAKCYVKMCRGLRNGSKIRTSYSLSLATIYRIDFQDLYERYNLTGRFEDGDFFLMLLPLCTHLTPPLSLRPLHSLGWAVKVAHAP